MSSIPQVLLLGNGINRAYGDKSWDVLIRNLQKNKKISLDDPEIEMMPYPLKVVLATGNKVDSSITEQTELFYGSEDIEDRKGILESLIALGFDEILTTNYGYELERTVDCQIKWNGKNLKKYMTTREKTERAESKYLLHTYNQMPCDKRYVNIWHIHGEARKPSSIVLGIDQYARLLNRYQEELKKRGNLQFQHQRDGTELIMSSWVDSFIMGDVYVLGFKYDYSETDLWWLLNRKKNEKAETGKLYYYAPGIGNARYSLLETYGAKIENVGYWRKPNDYRDFYFDAVSDIREKIMARRGK